jgi:hypothetical protein
MFEHLLLSRRRRKSVIDQQDDVGVSGFQRNRALPELGTSLCIALAG